MTMEVNYCTHPSLCTNEEEFRKKMVEKIKSYLIDILDDEEINNLELNKIGLEQIIEKYFRKP